MESHAVSAILEEMATLLELAGDNPFKCRAYEQAARAVSGVDHDLETAVRTGALKAIPGIGAGLTEVITELVTTGRVAAHEALKSSIPAGVVEMLKIPGLGAKKVRALYGRLGVTTIGELESACHENRLLALTGFGARSQAKILEGIRQITRHRGWVLMSVAEEAAREIQAALASCRGLTRLALAGDLRRRREVIGEVTFVASAEDASLVVERFIGLPQVQQVLEQDATGAKVQLRPGLRAALQVVPNQAFACALFHLTGSDAHIAAIRQRAAGLGLTLTDRGLSRNGSPVPCPDEAALFHALGLPEIPPELQEGLGEVAAAAAGGLPALIEPGMVRGVFHVHTTESDGRASLEQMVRTAEGLGYEYIGISDHSQSARYAHGLTVERVRRQHVEIARLRDAIPGILILHGAEVDILDDGTLDYPDEVLASFDFVIASVHSRFTMPEDKMTARICRAIRHPAVTILGHPTGRLLLTREAYPVNLGRVMAEAKTHGVIIELNAHPSRLDLDWRVCRDAKAQGVLLSINPDAHSADGLAAVRFGVGIARKGWLGAADVFNTRPAAAVLDYLAARKVRATAARAGNA